MAEAVRAESASAEVVVLEPVDRVFEVVTAADPARWYPRSGPLPAVVRVEDREGAFSVVGDRRRLVLSDGGTVRETLVDVDAPRWFAYELREFTGFFAVLVDGARAEWTFTPDGAATRIRWTYGFRPRPGRRLLVRLIVRLLWSRYMRRVLPPIAREAGRLA